ncbi:MAG: hypothetical protein Q9179_001360 [Wetmoreana sp. 5 TL-2023]
MPGPAEDNLSNGTNSGGPSNTRLERSGEANVKQPEEQRQEHNNEGNPFSPELVDEESVTTGTLDPPKTFGDRLRHLIRLRKRTSDAGSVFTGDEEKDQLIKSRYPKLAAYLNADPNFLIYRKFGWLHNRLLLYLQDELVELEYKLEKIDKRTFSEADDTQLKSRRLDLPSSPVRQNLIKQIAEKLEIYEYRWIREGVDLAAVGHGGEHGWFNGFLEDTLKKISRKGTQAIFRTKEQEIITGHENVSLISPYRLDIFLRIVLTFLALTLLLIPVLILFKLQPTDPEQVRSNSKYQITTIFVSTLLFSASCSVVTKARRQEVFTATAAYCAVLVVFLGNTLNVLTGGR